MKKVINLFPLISNFLLSFLLLVFFTCGESKLSDIKSDAELSHYIPYISEYTSGTISCKSTIIVRLAQSIDLTNTDFNENGKVPEKIFRIEPGINGTAAWEDERTISFMPEEKLPQGENYTGKVFLKEIFDVSPDEEVFEFHFNIIEQDLEITAEDITFEESGGKNYQNVKGRIETADWVDIHEIEKVVSAKFMNNNRAVTWEHDLEKNIHSFAISRLERSEEASTLTINWNGDSIGVNKKGSINIDIYGIGDFLYLSHKISTTPELHVQIQFSMPLDSKQNLTGLVRLDGDSNFRMLADNNILRIYPSGNHQNTVKVILDQGLKDTTGSRLGENIEFFIAFRQEKPEIRWIRDTGGIIPGSSGLILPFEAVSLKAVDVCVIEIFEDNIIQFFQVNRDIKGEDELRRVGRPVLYTTIDLEQTGTENLYLWNNYNLDLKNVISLNPGSLYQVRLNFRKSQSLYTCDDEGLMEDEIKEFNWDYPGAESSYWGYYEDYYYYGSWEDRNNPCKNAYYGSRREIKMNIMASSLGIVAKGSENGDIKIFITDMVTTQPKNGITVELYNYQQQLITTGKTDSYGSVEFNTEQAPFAVIVKDGKERGYLRIDPSTSLSLSNFDVGGTDSGKGIKGFIYGDRGVWRPGDTAYLNFILEDSENALPEYHPVIFELKNPLGQLVKKVVKTENVEGIYDFSFSTDNDAPTGNWSADIRVGGVVFHKTLKIETIKPNRLKIDLDFGKDLLTVQDTELTGNLEVKWLHGAVAKNLKAEFEVLLSPVKTTFADYPNFSFDDPSRDFSPQTQEIFSGRVDDNGLARFDFELNVQGNAPGALRALFSGKVFEEGGDFSINSFSIPYYPYESFTGVKLPPGDEARGMLLTDTDHKVQIVTVDSYGNPISRRGIEVELYKIQWRWWWDTSDETAYMSSFYENKISETTVNTTNGRGEYTLRIDYPSWGRYFLRVYDPVSKHSSGEIFYIDWPGWAGSAPRGELDGSSMLMVFADKKEYEVGDKAVITIPASEGSRALVSLETGSSIVNNFWVPVKADGNTQFEIEITEEMSPSLYVYVTLIQPHEQMKNDLPIRLYGIVPLKVVDSQTILHPVITMPDTLAPEKEVTIKVNERDGRQMAYTVVVVDQGLLDLTNFRTPNPWNTFYSKEALGVRTWDLYEDVIGAITDKFSPLITIGGSDEIEAPKPQDANRFEPVVKHFGPFYLSANSSKTHSFIMPQYVGAVRTMVIAAYDGAYGSAENNSFVKESLMVLSTMPRVLGPGENIQLPVNVFVLDDKIRDVDVSIRTEGLLEITGSSSKRLSFSGEDDKYVFFDLKTPESIGTAKVYITAVSGKESSTNEIEIGIRPSNALQTNIIQSLINEGEQWSDTISTIGIEGTNINTIELSSLPPIDLEKRLGFLIRYPHGCIEQTTSSVFPQLFLDKLVELTPDEKSQIQNNIEAGIERLKSFRTTSGGFSYWPGSNDPSEWGTNYAGHFLILARENGYYIEQNIMTDWKNYQTSVANRWDDNLSDNADLAQAYRLYTLALYGEPALGAMNRMKEKRNLSVRAKWRLAAAYAVIEKESVARELVYKLNTNVADYTPTSYTYGSSLRDTAMILETLILLGDKENGFGLLQKIAEGLSSEKWYSTQTTSYCLLAVAEYSGIDSDRNNIIAEVNFAGSKEIINSEMSYVSINLETVPGNITVNNNGDSPLYARLILQGIPLTGEEKTGHNILGMDVKYTDKNGIVIRDISSLQQGTDIIIETRITNSGALGDLDEIALTQIFPSGWEIINARLTETEAALGTSTPEYQDIRDDRVLTYFDLKSGETKTFKVIITAAYLGEFYMPGINCEAMYYNEAYARNKGMVISVYK